MPVSQENQIFKLLGQLEATAKSIDDKVDALKTEALRSESRSDQHRANLHRRLDEVVSDVSEIKEEVSGTTSRLDAVQLTVDDTKKVTDEVKRWKLMGLGALGVVGIGGTALGVFLARPLEALIAFLRGS